MACVHEPRHSVIDLGAAPFVPKKTRVEQHNGIGKLIWDPDRISLYVSPDQKRHGILEDGLLGDGLRRQLEGRHTLNANVLHFLFEHPCLIPSDWKGKYVFFWGTIYRERRQLFVPYLGTGIHGQWYSLFKNVNSWFDDRCYAAVSRQDP